MKRFASRRAAVLILQGLALIEPGRSDEKRDPETSTSSEGPTNPTLDCAEPRRVSTSWFNQPLSGTWCVLGWLGAIAVFMAVVRFVGGGPSEVDLGESIYSTWAVAHGHLSCAISRSPRFISRSSHGPAHLLPRFGPILGGWPPYLGSATASHFRRRARWDPTARRRWSPCTNGSHSDAVLPTMRIGYVSWPVLMAGVIAVLRASGRGRCRWEPTVLVLLAVASPVWMPLTMAFHPQDLIAMGLALGGVACVLQGRWIGAGVLLGLAITSQQLPCLSSPLSSSHPRIAG